MMSHGLPRVEMNRASQRQLSSAPDGRVVAADPIGRDLRLAGIAECLQPVRADQHAGLVAMDGVAIAGDVLLEALPREIPPCGPVGIAGVLGRLGDAGLRRERLAAAVAIAGFHGPQVAVDPKTVDAVAVDEFQQLRNHQFVDVGATRTHLVAAGRRHAHEAAADRFSVLAPQCTIRDAWCRPTCHRCRNSGSAAASRAPCVAARHPDERILDDARTDGGAGRLAEPTGQSGVTFAVGLDEIRPGEPQHLCKFFRIALGADITVALQHVEVVMESEAAFRAVPISSISSLRLRFGRGGTGGCACQNAQ